MQCTNHLKQIGLAIHNFHDSQRGLPPLAIGGGSTTGTSNDARRMAWGPFLFPYMEQAALWDFIEREATKSVPANPDATGNTGGGREGNWIFCNRWFGSLSQGERQALAIRTFVCPTRRGGGNLVQVDGTVGYAFQWENYYLGPQADYSAVIYLFNKTQSDQNNPDMWWLRWGNLSLDPHMHGPLRIAILENNQPATWLPRVTMSWWEDGSSNQLVLGEKHISAGGQNTTNGLNDCRPAGNGNHRDCSYLMSGHAQTGVMNARTFMNKGANVLLSRPQDASNGQDGTSASFGSWHPGSCNFLLGDGAVVGLSVTTSATVLQALAQVNDGRPVALPD
jgi:hypothetical protein